MILYLTGYNCLYLSQLLSLFLKQADLLTHLFVRYFRQSYELNIF